MVSRPSFPKKRRVKEARAYRILIGLDSRLIHFLCPPSILWAC